jgi:outer membrane protein assembly factor BamB
VRLVRRWEWSVADGGFVALAEAADDLLLACSPNSGVVALRDQGSDAALVWRHPDPAGESLELVWALGGAGRTRLFVAFQRAWSAPVVHALSAADDTVSWQRDLGQGVVYSAAADRQLVYLHHGARAGQRLRVFEAETGAELASMDVPAALTPLVTPTGTEGRVLYGAGSAVVEYDATAGASRVLADRVLRPLGDQQIGSLVAAGPRVYATDGRATVVAIDRSPGGGMLWQQVLPGQPEPGEPVYAPTLDAVVVCGLDGAVYCLAGGDGALRWVSRGEGRGSSETVGVPAVVGGAAGTFVAFPGVDETLYLASGETGAIEDRVPFDWPLEVALHSRPGQVLVPHAMGVTAFELRA